MQSCRKSLPRSQATPTRRLLPRACQGHASRYGWEQDDQTPTASLPVWYGPGRKGLSTRQQKREQRTTHRSCAVLAFLGRLVRTVPAGGRVGQATRHGRSDPRDTVSGGTAAADDGRAGAPLRHSGSPSHPARRVIGSGTGQPVCLEAARVCTPGTRVLYPTSEVVCRTGVLAGRAPPSLFQPFSLPFRPPSEGVANYSSLATRYSTLCTRAANRRSAPHVAG